MKTTLCHRRASRPGRARRGQSLVEFSLVALVVYILFAGIIEFGRLYFGAQTIQSAADFAARELSRAPLPATATLAEALTWQDATGNSPVQSQIYTEDYLAIDLTNWMNSSSGLSLVDYVDSLSPPVPPVNKLLLPLMFVDSATVQSLDVSKPLLRYPGALITSSTAPSGFTVKVPLVVTRSATGSETIVWHSVVEGIPFGTQQDVFSVTSGTSGAPAGGLAAVRINYPFQAATMVSYPQNLANPLEPNVLNPNQANDAAVQASDPNNVLDGQSLVAPNLPVGSSYSGTYGGAYGLGTYGAVGQVVRPFRKVISCQAIYRREVFSGP